jgi:plastocyanin
VTWANFGNVPHNAVADDGTFDTGLQQRDASQSTVLDRPGTYLYVCTIHPTMEGTVTVR